MALFDFECPSCYRIVKRLANKEPNIECTNCHVLMVRKSNPPNTQVKEVLDNGFMTKRVERLKDAEELYKNRKKKE